LKIRPNACRHLKNLCKLGLRPKFGLRTNSDLFYQVTHRVSLALNDLVEVSLFIKSHKTGPRHIFTVTHGFQTASQDFPLLVSTQTLTCCHYLDHVKHVDDDDDDNDDDDDDDDENVGLASSYKLRINVYRPTSY